MSRSAHAPAPRSTCPWGPENAQMPVAPARIAQAPSTCPWAGDDARDGHSKALEAAARRRLRGSPSEVAAAPPYGVSAARAEKAEAAEAVPSASPGQQPPPPMTMNNEEKEAQKRALIQECLQRGMSEEEIYEVLDEFNNQQFLEELERKNAMAEVQAAAEKAAPLRELNSQDRDDNISLAGKRARAREISSASIAAYDGATARTAYAASQKSAQAARDRNRGGSGIF